MKTMLQTQGYAAPRAGGELKPFAFARRDLRENDVDIDIQFCGICHSDIHQARDEWGGAIYPMVPGHEIAGVVTAVGSAVSKFRPGDRVGVGCLVDSCGTCDSCRRGLEQYCLKGNVPTYNGIDKDGNPTYGGYSQRIVVKEDFVLRIPDALPLDAAAPLLCAGITTYSPLRHWQAGPGKKVAIVGMGGLGHVGVKIARAMGAHVTVLSQTLSKKADGERLGAHAYHATADPRTFEQLAGHFDLILNTVSAQLDWNAYLSLLRVDGALVVVGAPPDPVPVAAFNLIAGRHTLAGSGIGGIQETQEMLDFCAEHGIAADIERIGIQDVNKAFERVLKSDVRYRFVIEIDSLRGNAVEV